VTRLRGTLDGGRKLGELDDAWERSSGLLVQRVVLNYLARFLGFLLVASFPSRMRNGAESPQDGHVASNSTWKRSIIFEGSFEVEIQIGWLASCQSACVVVVVFGTAV